MKDYYQILGVTKSATDDEIKKAYRKLAHQYHPDKKGGDEAKFKEINEAYQTLSDRNKRAQYDRFGGADPFAGFGGGGAGFDWSNMEGATADMGDLGDIFETFFEGLGVRPKRPTYRKGSDLEIAIELSLEESFHGLIKELRIKTLVGCDSCKGKGGDPEAGYKQCTVCQGRGEVREEQRTFFGSFSQVKACTACLGFGQIPNKICSTCKGAGRTSGERRVTVDVLPGVHDSQIIKLKGMGEAGERGTDPGDLYVRVRVKPHGIFRREGDDLVINKEAALTDLLLHKELEVRTISGGTIKVEVPAGFNLKEPLRVPGEGMPRFGSFGRGSLLIDLVVKVPKKPGAKTQKALEDLD
jgi:molecular chaperone DnaJ